MGAGVEDVDGPLVRGEQDRSRALGGSVAPGGVGGLDHDLAGSGVDPPCLVVGVQDAWVAGAQLAGRGGFPPVSEPPQRRELRGPAAFGEQVERPAGVDGGQLGVVADDQHLRPRCGRLGGQGVQGERAGQGRFVDDQELPGTHRPAGVLALQCPHRCAKGVQLGPVADRVGALGCGGQLGEAFPALARAGADGLVQPLGGVLTLDAERVGELGGGGGGRGQPDYAASPVGALPGVT